MKSYITKGILVYEDYQALSLRLMPREERILFEGTDPESCITKHTLVYTIGHVGISKHPCLSVCLSVWLSLALSLFITKHTLYEDYQELLLRLMPCVLPQMMFPM